MFFKKEKFKFTSKAVDEDTFYVISFWGKEGLSLLYQFEIHLVSENENIKHEDIIKNRARFSIIREDGSKVNFNGVISSFEQLHQVDKYTFYKATLVPKLWYLTLTYHNQIFLNKTPIQLIESTLKDAGLFRNDYELKLQKKYPEYEFICQYNETHFNFLNRWLEREGIYYYFDQS